MTPRPDHPALYFGYGSNLNADDLAAWCRARGLDPAGIRPLAPAFLHDHTVGFTVHSVGRQGGVLDILPEPGHVVPGALFTIDLTLGGWHILDRKEDVGDKYERHAAVVVDAAGQRHHVQTYSVLPALRQAHVPPHHDYVSVVCAGLKAFGHPDHHIRRAARHT